MTNHTDVEWPYPGARWWRFDFHTHTPASIDTYWHSLKGGHGELKPEQWLQRYMDAEIDCVAITDHNSGDWIDMLKNAYERMQEKMEPNFRELHLFPGIEISVNSGFHLLAVLDKDRDKASIDTLIGKVDFDGTRGDCNEVTRKSPVAVVEAVLEAGGIPIPAHVDFHKGLLRVKKNTPASPELDPNTIIQVLDQPDIIAMEVVDRSCSKPSLYTERDLSWTEIIGSDCHSFQGENLPGSRFTWVKMEEPSLEGLRLALLDGNGFSIRRSDDFEPFNPFGLPEHFIESIEISNARYMGRGQPAKLKFSPWLNGLVGGRGTGKSTVIHALRLAARREEELTRLETGSDALSTFRRFNQVPSSRLHKGGLTSSTEIRWCVMRDGERYRVRWRQDGSGCAVEESIGNADQRPSKVQSVTSQRFPMRIFSQGQIAELAGENQQALLQFVDDAAGVAEFQRKLGEAQDAFFVSRAQIRKLDSKLSRRDDLLVDMQDVERKLKRFEEAGHKAILTSYRQRDAQRNEVERRIDLAKKAARLIETTAEALQSEDLRTGVFREESKEDRQVIEALHALAAGVDIAAVSLRTYAQQLNKVIDEQRHKLAKSVWQAAVEQASSGYKQLIEALRAEDVSDPDEYGQLVQERQRIGGEMKILDSISEDRSNLEKQTHVQFKRIQNARREVSACRQEYLKNVLKHNKFVRIEIQAYGEDAKVAERSLRGVLDIMDDRFQNDILVMDDDRPTEGVLADLYYDLSSGDSVSRCTEIDRRLKSLKDRFVASSTGSGGFGGHFNNYLSREFGRKPEMLDRLMAWFPEDGLSVEYSRNGDGTHFVPINQASAGQRAAAMLAFLLAHGKEPLVLDQPEDDLDNYLIYDLVVRQIRANKLGRQIIVVTHNPNIVVNGDSEMLHVLHFNSGQCNVKKSGSLQKKEIRDEVCRVMEGGREAFERRYRRLGPDSTNV